MSADSVNLVLIWLINNILLVGLCIVLERVYSGTEESNYIKLLN